MNPSGNYLKLTVPVPSGQGDAIVAFLSSAGFDGFEEEDNRIYAFIPEAQYDAGTTAFLLTPLIPGFRPDIEVIAPQNWNEEWERNFQPVHVGSFVQVLPTFKEAAAGFAQTLWIEPKMSFGTGHHETTRLMMEWCETIDFKGKRVLDMGCGTGILGILASRLGAEKILAVDNDPWCVENSNENAALNAVNNMEIRLGGAEILPESEFDIILANINRNVLIDDCRQYRGALKPGGVLAMSGFFDFDEELITKTFSGLGLEPAGKKEHNGWMQLAFSKAGH